MKENNDKWSNPLPQNGLEHINRTRGAEYKGFTLAETLIALVVIGIVAALTVPAVIAHQREIATVEKVKKFYSTMSNAVKRAIADTGLQTDEWDLGGETSFNRDTSVRFMSYLKPYLVLAVDDCAATSSGVCYKDFTTKFLNGNTNSARYYASTSYYKAILNDGGVFWLRTWSRTSNGKCETDSGVQNACASVWYDINGLKEPNTLGKDIFRFIIRNDSVVPDMKNDCNYNNQGWGCAKYILKNNNMDYLH